MTDLNEISGGARLYLLLAFSINNGGTIVGFGATEHGELHPFAALPSDSPAAAHLVQENPRPVGVMAISREAREKARRQLPFGQPIKR